MNSYLGYGVYLSGGVRLETASEIKIRPTGGTKNTSEILLKDCNIQISKEHLKNVIKNFDEDEIEEIIKEIKTSKKGKEC